MKKEIEIKDFGGDLFKEELMKCIWNISHYLWSQVSSASFFLIYTVCQHQKRTPRKHFPSSFLFLQLTKMFNTLGFFFFNPYFQFTESLSSSTPGWRNQKWKPQSHGDTQTVCHGPSLMTIWNLQRYRTKTFFEVSVCCPHFFFFFGARCWKFSKCQEALSFLSKEVSIHINDRCDTEEDLKRSSVLRSAK